MTVRERWRSGLRLTKAQNLELCHAVRKAELAGSAKLVRRLRAILLVGQEHLTQASAGKAVGVTTNSVTRWVMAYKRSGVQGLQLRTPPGAKSRLSERQLRRLRKLVIAGPEACGYDTGIWDGPLVRDLIKRRFNVEYSAPRVRAILHKIRLSVKKPKQLYSESRESVKRQWLKRDLPQIKAEAKSDGGVPAMEDETSFKRSGTLHSTWGPVGEAFQIKSKPGRISIRAFGMTTLDAVAPQFHFRFEPGQFNAATFTRFLEQVTKPYSKQGRRLHLILDGAAYHTAVIPWAEEHSDVIKLHFLPPYCPDLNAQEPVWQLTKRRATHNRFFDREDRLQETVKRRFNRFQGNPASLRQLIAPWT